MVPSFCRGCGPGEGSCDGDLPAEDLSPILVQGLEPDALHGQGQLAVYVELAAALSVSDTQPVGRLIARSEEARALTERLEQDRAQGISAFPVGCELLFTAPTLS